MQMSNEKKKDILLKNFEIIKDKYEGNVESLGLVVQKMLALDEEVALDIWSFLLAKYKSRIRESGSYNITGNIIYEIGDSRIRDIVIKSPIIKDSLFSQSYYTSMQAYFVRSLIKQNDLQIADDLLNLLYYNSYKKESWFEIMDCAIPHDDSDITSEAYELLEMWCDKVKNKEERAKLSIKMLAFID